MKNKKQLRRYQMYGVERLLEITENRRAALLADEPGLGKALVHGTGVATPKGFVPIESLSVGDLVFGPDGKPRPVTGVYPQGLKPCYALTFSDGNKVFCCEDHLWRVQNRRDYRLGRPGEVLSTIEISKTYLTSQGRRRYYVPVTAALEYQTTPGRVIPAYTMGALLANGGLSGPSVKLTTSDTDIVAKVSSELPAGLIVKRGRLYDWLIASPYGGAPNVYRRELDRLGLRSLSINKHIPAEYLYAADRLELLQGLMDGDGYVSKEGTIQYNTSSPLLADHVSYLLESFGCVVRKTVKPSGYKKEGRYVPCHDSYTLTIRPPAGLELFRCSERKDYRYRSAPAQKYVPQRLIARVEPAGVHPCTCISVDSDDHMYLTEHYIPTHNTAMTSEYINRTMPETVLIVCPASLRMNWRSELQEWVIGTMPHVEILSYEQITSGKQELPSYDLIVFDEAHYLKNENAARTKACLALVGGTRLFLTGTPIVNRPMDIFPILKSMGMKWSKREYGKKFCAGYLKLVGFRPKKYAWDFSGASNTEELGRLLRKHVMVRRTKAEVLTELPPKIRTVIELDIPPVETPDMVSAARRYFDALDTAAENIDELEHTLFEELASVRREEANRKLPQTMRFLCDLLQEEEKVVVFAYHREVLEAMRKGFTEVGVPSVLLYGGLSDKAKNEAVTEFQEGGAQVFLGQITAAGTGLTLTASHTVVFAEHDWVPGNLTQAEDRCHRIGQKLPVRIIHLVPAKSIEARMIRIVTEKQQVIDGVMN